MTLTMTHASFFTSPADLAAFDAGGRGAAED